MLLLEGLASERDPFVADLVSRMQAAGIEGTLTGASSAGGPAWAADVPYATQLAAVIGFRPQTGRRWLDDGWIGGPEQEPAVIDVGARWLAGAAQTVIFHGPQYFSSWSEPAAAARLTMRLGARQGVALSEAYDEQQRETRRITVYNRPGILEAAHDLSAWVTTRLDEDHASWSRPTSGPGTPSPAAATSWSTARSSSRPAATSATCCSPPTRPQPRPRHQARLPNPHHPRGVGLG